MTEESRMISVPVWSDCLGQHVPMTFGPGGHYECNGGGPDEEGFEYTQTRIEYVEDEGGGSVVFTCETRSRDCDGPHESHWTGVWDETAGEWVKIEEGQRDHFAEQMGY